VCGDGNTYVHACIHTYIHTYIHIGPASKETQSHLGDLCIEGRLC